MKRIIIIIFYLFPYILASAQSVSFEEYARGLTKDFSTYEIQQQQSFEAYRNRLNAEFAEYMRQTWPEYKSKPAEPVSDSPEPPAPVIKDPDTPPSNDPIPFDDVKPAPKPVAPPQPVVPMPKPEPKPQPVKPDSLTHGPSSLISPYSRLHSMAQNAKFRSKTSIGLRWKIRLRMLSPMAGWRCRQMNICLR